MNDWEELKEQIARYLDILHEYRAEEEAFIHAAAETWAVTERNREETVRRIRSEISDFESKITQLKEMKEKLDTVCDAIEQNIHRRVELQIQIGYPDDIERRSGIKVSVDSVERAAAEEEAALCERAVAENYALLCSLREKYAKEYASMLPVAAEKKGSVETCIMIGNEWLNVTEKKGRRSDIRVGSLADIETERVIKHLQQAIKSKKKEIARLEKPSPLLLDQISDQEERSRLERGCALIERLAINCGIDAEEYPELLRLAALASARPELAHLAPPFDDPALSVVCNQFCNELLRKLANATALKDVAEYQGNRLYQEGLTKEMFEDFGVRYGQERALVPPDGAEAPLFLSEDFLCEVLAVLEEEPEISLPRLAIRLIGDSPVKDYLKQLKEFKRLYEETPEERLVTEQRYYQQKILEEAQEKNRLLEQQMREERIRRREEQKEAERRYREEQEERERRERELERERDRERWREEEREKEREEEQRRAENERRREEADRQRREDSATRHQCNTCANAGHCSSYMRRPNCAAYRPR